MSSTGSSARSRGRAADGGQATVELALALPAVAVALLLVVQVGLAVRAQLLVVHAAREAARAAAVGEEPPPPDGLAAGRTRVELVEAAGRIRATVTYRFETGVPLVGTLVPDLQLRGGATMRVEQP